MNPLAFDRSAYLRGAAAAVGIEYAQPDHHDEDGGNDPPRSQAVEPVDRDRVLEILIAAGAPKQSIEWLMDSCPSMEAARAYRTTEGVLEALHPDTAWWLDETKEKR